MIVEVDREKTMVELDKSIKTPLMATPIGTWRCELVNA